MKTIFRKFVLTAVLVLPGVSYAVDVDWDDLGQGNGTILNSGATVAATNNACSSGSSNCDTTATVTFEIVNDGQGGELACGWNSGGVCGAFFNTEFGGRPTATCVLHLMPPGPTMTTI